VALVSLKNPVFLGLAYGFSIATFWPSFNLLQFRLSETESRAFLMSLMMVAIPSITGIFGPASGGFIVETFGFPALFVTSIALYLTSFVFSLKIRYKSEVQRFSLPKNKLFIVFMITFVLLGFSEPYWLAYPLFVRSVSSTILQTGLVFTASSLIVTFANLGINKLSDIKKMRTEFAVIGSVMFVLWYFAIAYASTAMEIVVLSLLSGFAEAFSLSWFAYYGDSFGREHHATILVMMEVALMIGRILNLAPTYFYIAESSYTAYFMLLGVVSSLLIPFYLLSKKVRNINI
jgi:MFS family permease